MRSFIFIVLIATAVTVNQVYSAVYCRNTAIDGKGPTTVCQQWDNGNLQTTYYNQYTGGNNDDSDQE